MPLIVALQWAFSGWEKTHTFEPEEMNGESDTLRSGDAMILHFTCQLGLCPLSESAQHVKFQQAIQLLFN